MHPVKVAYHLIRCGNISRSFVLLGTRVEDIRASCCFCNKYFPDGRITDFEAHLTDTDKGCKAKEYTLWCRL